MQKIITIASQKGGVGKTTTSLNLGYSLGRLGFKTLLIDLDPQSGMTIASNLRNFTKLGMIDLLSNRCEAKEILAEAKDGSITVVGMGDVPPDDMSRLEQAAWDGTLASTISFLGTDFQYIIIDAPAGVGGIVHSTLSISDSTILIANCSPITLKSLPSFLKMVDYIATNKNPKLCLLGVLLSMLQASSETEMEIFNQIQEALPIESFFRTVIPYDERFGKASLEAIPAALLPEGDEINRLYLELALELREREMNQQNQNRESHEPSKLF